MSRESGGVDLLPNISLDALINAQNLLNSSMPNNIWSIMSTIHNLSISIHDSMSKFDWDVFIPMENETELEKLAGDYQRQNEMGITYVVAGIVFEPDIPVKFKSTTIKIRTNFSLVVDTAQYKEE